VSRRKWIILGACLLSLTVGAELIVRFWSSSKGCVQVVNQGNAAIDDLVVSYGGTKITVGRVPAGQSTHVWFTPIGKATLVLAFNQKGNALKGFHYEDFDPAEMARTGFKLVLVVEDKQVQRFMDEDQSRKPLNNLAETVKEWFLSDVEPPR